MSFPSFAFMGFCKLCSSEAKSNGYCGRHAWRYFPPGEECAWCGADLEHESKRCWNQRNEAFCRPSHRSSSGRALRRLQAREDS